MNRERNCVPLYVLLIYSALSTLVPSLYETLFVLLLLEFIPRAVLLPARSLPFIIDLICSA
jgi:uncharacterized membrane protein